jgi:hypothetical protein
MTVLVGLATDQGAFGIRYADTTASAVPGAVPLVAVFLLRQRHIVQGIAGTGLNGRMIPGPGGDRPPLPFRAVPAFLVGQHANIRHR